MSEIQANSIGKYSGNNISLSDPLKFKSYTTTQRDALSSVAGDVIFNTTTNKLELFSDGAWSQMGGVDAFSLEYLLVAGGGGGASGFNNVGGTHNGGGGGAGGLLSNVSGDNTGGGVSAQPSYFASKSVAYRVRVGAGGAYGNSVNFSYSIVEDFITEGIEQFQIEIRTDGYATGSPVATSGVITINDTSRAPGSAANGLTFGPVQVNRDGGTVANATDWYKICNIDDLPEGSSIALFIDGSGSMTQATVQASYNAFVAKLNEKNITITTVTNGNEDWITPFLVDLP